MTPEERILSPEDGVAAVRSSLSEIIRHHGANAYLLQAARKEVEVVEKAHDGSEAGSALLGVLYDPSRT